MELKEKLVALRKEKGLTQSAVAEKLDVSRQAISRWESGIALPSTDNLKSLSALYGVPVDYLLNSDTEEQRVTKGLEAENIPMNGKRTKRNLWVVLSIVMIVYTARTEPVIIMKGMILEKYKKVIVLLLLSVAVILCGCEERANLKTIPIETPVWETISTNDIVYPEEESLGDIPLDQLVSACLSGDESWAEACDDELYHRFVEAPFTVCSYISLIQDDEKIERVCDGISVAEVCWGLDQEIEDIISNMREFSLSSAEAHTVSILENSYQRIVELNK